MNNNTSKQITLSVIGVAILVVAVVGVSFAFFSYFGEESTNNIKTGQISFSATSENISLTNAFPSDGKEAATSTIKVMGNTTYENGIDFRVVVTDVTDGTNGKLVPTVSVNTVANNQGITVTPEDTTVEKGNVLVSGNIPNTANMTQLTDILTISAYFSSDDYHISNLEHSEENIQKLKDASLLDADFDGTLITQDAWNTYAAGTAYSFSIQVVATEGE